ncbi:hypothetical protein [Duganella sp. BuS-21]|uniref:hypothetical protein n=1 Tax=Duganella sp. BuS-21 TaxID=2943848 RepID=UPI0035A71A70
MMRAAALNSALAAVATAAALALSAPAQAQTQLGRLFSTPAERDTMEAGRGNSAALLPNSQGVAPAPGMPGGPAAAPGMGAGAAPAAPAAAPTLTMSGVLRSSDNRGTVWLNGVPQPGLQTNLSRQDSLTVTLPSGKKIVLKAGQRYDLNENRIKDVNEP